MTIKKLLELRLKQLFFHRIDLIAVPPCHPCLGYSEVVEAQSYAVMISDRERRKRLA